MLPSSAKIVLLSGGGEFGGRLKGNSRGREIVCEIVKKRASGLSPIF
jgi:hypothetical protein